MKKLISLLLQAILILTLSFSLLKATQPNVVVIVADDLGYADMSFLPQAPADIKKFGTPGIDRLAKTGTYFANGYSTSSICSPSRAGLITGRYQQRWGNYSYGQGGLDPSELTIPEALNDMGYATSKIGKTHMNGGPKTYPPTLHGFEEAFGYQGGTWDYIRLSEKDVEAYNNKEGGNKRGHQVVGPLLKVVGRGNKIDKGEYVSYENRLTTDIFTEEAISFIERQTNERPFYLHLSHLAVHQPTYIVNEKWAKKVGARYVPWDRNAKKWSYPYWEPSEEKSTVFHQRWGHMGEIDPHGRRCYLANLLALDDGINRVLDALKEKGILENTLVFFISDNGGTATTFADNTPLRGSKYMYSEGGIRIPFIVSMPGTLPQGEFNTQALVSTMDIFPTILDLIGKPSPSNLDGKSILPILKGEKKTQHEWLAWAKSRTEWVIRKGKWKLSNNNGWNKYNYAKFNENGDVERGDPVTYPNGLQLFNLEDDIGETVNLAHEYPNLIENLKEIQSSWAAEMADPIKSKDKYASRNKK